MAFAAVFIVGAVIVYASFIRPALDEAEIARGEVASKGQVLELHQGAAEQVQSIITQFQNLGQVRQTVGLAIPDEPGVTDALNQFYAIARNEGVELKGFSLDEGVGPPAREFLVQRLGILTVSMSVEGRYESVKGFLEGVETNIRVANVMEVGIAPVSQDSTGSTDALFSMDLMVEVYYQRTE